MKIEEMKVLADKSNKTNNIERLVSACASKIVENMERQLSMMAFFRDEVNEETVEKMSHAPLSNSGCESRMAQLDVRVRFSGGAAPVNTISDKQVISVNKFLLTEEMKDDDHASKMFLWARTSDEAKLADNLQKEFFSRVKLAHRQASIARYAVKQRRMARALQLARNCQVHGGPVTAYNLDLLETLDENQIIQEVSYLKATIASELKLKKRVTDSVSKKYKMLKLPTEQLKLSIKNVLQPSNGYGADSVENLLDKVFKSV